MIFGNSGRLALGGHWGLVTPLGTQWRGGDTDGWADGRTKSESQESEAVENWSLRGE